VDLLKEPDRVFLALKQAAYQLVSVENSKYAESIRKDLEVRIRGIDATVPLGELGTARLNTLVSISGMVVRASVVRPLLKEPAYRCSSGGHLVYGTVDWDELKVERPSDCEVCHDKSLKRESRSGRYVDVQLLRIQELPEELPPGQIPRGQEIVLVGDLVNSVRPGDKVAVSGIPRALANQVRRDSAVGDFRIECNHIEAVGKEPEFSLADGDDVVMKAIAFRPEAYDDLIKSVAPAVLGHRRVKEAMLLQLAGCPPTHLPDGTVLRGDIHILLPGDPSVAKSEFLRFSAMVAPRGIYASGKGTSAAGLTAAVVKDRDEGWALEVGVTVLGDLGVSAIDEFDKMRPEDRGALHEVMEQQRCTISKAGIQATLNARTSILAAMNPVLGVYNPYQSLTENLGDMPIPLLGRFDLILVLRDDVDPVRDEALAEHILATRQKAAFAEAPPIDTFTLKKYIAYVKRTDPKMSDGAKSKIKEYWVELRRKTQEGMIGATPRTLESLHRLSTARARLLLHDEVSEEDALAAIDLMNCSMREALTDGKSGIDFGPVTVGKSQSERSALGTAIAALKETGGPDNKAVEIKQFKEALLKTKKFAATEEVDKMVAKMFREGFIYESKPGFCRRLGA